MPITLVYNSNLVSSNCCAWTVPNGVNSVTFEVWGGGGGGGSTATTCDCCARGQSGGGGGYSMKTISVTPGDIYTVCAGNGACTSAGFGYGSETAYCSNGYAGGTSYVTGTNLSNFCATGGQGGNSSINNCYRSCGCNANLGGVGFGGDVMETGGNSVQGSMGSNAQASWTMGGQGAGPGGGVGGFNTGGINNSTCSGAHAAASGDNPYLWGVFPGGGGAGAGYTCCACCNRPGGAGAAGLVKITW